MRVLVAAAAFLICVSSAYAQTRIKDITRIHLARENVVIGYGLVVGLAGTGDTARNAIFTRQSVKSMLDRLGVSIRDEDIKTRNVAAVLVTAPVSTSDIVGSRVDVSVSSLGDATSLRGGALVMTPLSGADGIAYAVAQGQINVSGFDARGQAEAVTEGVTTGGRIPNGAIVERKISSRAIDNGKIEIELYNADARTAVAVVDTINEYTSAKYKIKAARELSPRLIEVTNVRNVSPTRLISELGELQVVADVPARIVIDPRSGTVVMNAAVQISRVAVTQGNLTVKITEAPIVSQPQPMSQGATVVTPSTTVQARETGGHFVPVGGSNLATLIDGLNQIGVKPSGVVSILQAIKSAGALQAELVIQ